MNTVTIAVAVVIFAVAVIAAIGSYKTLRSESCCCDDEACSCDSTKRCSIRKNDGS